MTWTIFVTRNYRRDIISIIKDIGAKIFRSVDVFFLIFLRIHNEVLVSEMQKESRVTDFIPEIKHVENYPDCENWFM